MTSDVDLGATSAISRRPGSFDPMVCRLRCRCRAQLGGQDRPPPSVQWSSGATRLDPQRRFSRAQGARSSGGTEVEHDSWLFGCCREVQGPPPPPPLQADHIHPHCRVGATPWSTSGPCKRHNKQKAAIGLELERSRLAQRREAYSLLRVREASPDPADRLRIERWRLNPEQPSVGRSRVESGPEACIRKPVGIIGSLRVPSPRSRIPSERHPSARLAGPAGCVRRRRGSAPGIGRAGRSSGAGESAAFVCRCCDLGVGHESDPTADEAELAELLGVPTSTSSARWAPAGGARPRPAEDDVQWFVSGEPAQVAVGVQDPFFVLARPLTSWGEGRPWTADDGRSAASAGTTSCTTRTWWPRPAEAIASSRRRSFRWCRTCRRATAPESFDSSEGSCEQCVSRFADPHE